MNKIEISKDPSIFDEPWSFKKIMGLLAIFGPAAIVASVAIGAGETIMVTRAGTWGGYNLLWLVLLACLVKGVFVTYLIGRYTAISGEYIGHRLVRAPGPRGWLLITLLILELIGAPLAWVPIAKPCGDLFHFLLSDTLSPSIQESTWENIITTIFIGLALSLSLRLSFERLEKQQLTICGILITGTILGTLLVRPDFVKAFIGTISFGSIPTFPEWAPEDAIRHPMLTLATTFAYIGGSVIAYIVYSNWVGIRRWGLTGHNEIEKIRRHAFTSDSIDYLPEDPDQVSRLRKLVAPLSWDVGMGAIVLFIVTGTFMVSGAAVLFPLETRFEGWSLLTHQADVWNNIHPSLNWIYYICIIAALWGTLQALPEIYARVGQEFFQAIWPNRKWDYIKFKKIICLYIFITTMLIVWNNIPFDILTQVAGFLITNIAIALIMAGALYLNFKLPPPYRTHKFVLIGSIISTVILFVSSFISGWGLIGKLSGG